MFQISLGSIRKLYRLNPEHVAKSCNVLVGEYIMIENNTELLTVGLLTKIKKVMPFSADKLFIGRETEYLEYVKSQIVG